MKTCDQFLIGLALSASVAPALTVAAAPRPAPASVVATVALAQQARNSIHGQIFGEGGRPVTDVYVELLNDYYSTISQVRTSSGGRYNFDGLSAGRYKIRVRPFGTDYSEQTQDVEIVNYSLVQGGGADNKQLDFYLKLRPEVTYGPFAAPGAVFAESVPDAARKLYEKGVAELRAKNDKAAFESLKGALEIHPTYHAALDRLGSEYVVRGHHEAARILLTKSVEVNPRSFSSTFGLGVAQYSLKLHGPALENFQRAVALYNKSVQAHLYLGIALHRTGKLDQAEAALKRAREMSQGKMAEVHWQLARLYGEQKRYGEAADALEQFLKAQPDARDSEKISETIRQLRQKATTATP